uniref:Putative structural protein n=1 Tax=Tarsiger cyanurus ambidensovirus TaxID=2794449 RepID=A0A8A4XEI3_9VIRU|nr:MAG: putative structural protein [Tarsiger cyanurus ambidensovirus]
MTQIVPEYSQTFSIDTNNLPFPNHDSKLRNRFNQWKNRFNPIRRPQYERIPDSQPEIQETEFDTPEDTRIQIEPDPVEIDIPLELAESTPLLGTAAGGGALLGGTGSALGTGGTAATGILGATVLGAGAYGVKKLVDRAETKGYTLPESEYIGPGNPIPIGAAKNPSEQIAKEHDLAYTNAKTHSDVQSADREAYTKFRDEYHKSGDYYAKIGQLGLQAKAGIENIIGVQYPKNLGKLLIIFNRLRVLHS